MLVDEAHRTQEGDLGRKMREALPNAFLFGLTGTPINKRDRNTFYAFGAAEDAGGLHEPLLHSKSRSATKRRCRCTSSRGWSTAHRQGGHR